MQPIEEAPAKRCATSERSDEEIGGINLAGQMHSHNHTPRKSMIDITSHRPMDFEVSHKGVKML